METEMHALQMDLLRAAARWHFRDREDVYVGSNMFLYFSEAQTKKNDFRGPDVFIVTNTTRRVRKSWVVWGEGGRTPDLVVELTSDSTRSVDLGEKMRIYAHILKVQDYLVYDPTRYELKAFRRNISEDRYEPIEPDEQGQVECRSVGLRVAILPGTFQGVEGRWLRWLDGRGALVPIGDELAVAERERAEAERERTEAERERAEAEHERAEAEHERAEAERGRAEAERERAEELAERLRAYEAKFGELPDPE